MSSRNHRVFLLGGEPLESRRLLAWGEMASDDQDHGPLCTCGCRVVENEHGHVHELQAPTASAMQEDVAPIAGEAPYALEDTLRLHSNPGARHTIYLDFDGHTTQDPNWNDGAPFESPAYSLDDLPTFNDSELIRIQQIWQRVAEDFIPFNVNVTTEDPGAADLSRTGPGDLRWGQRVVIGGSGLDWYGVNVGGVAQLSSFNYPQDTPTFVFEDALSGSEKFIAEAATHEVGHALRLFHDGQNSTGQYAGHGSGEVGWAPIMGVGYRKQLTQWSHGEYPDANAAWQDDLNTIVSGNGFGYREDDHGNSASEATELDGVILNAAGIIERNSDTDVFSMTVGEGELYLKLDPFERGPNLDILAELYDAEGTLVEASNPDLALDATLLVDVPAGTYFLHVSGTGRGDVLAGGYSDYGSLGQYTVTGTAQAPVPSISVEAVDAVMKEGHDGAQEFVYRFTRSGDLAEPASVEFAVQADEAGASGADFVGGALPSGVVSWEPGQDSVLLVLPVAGDTEVEMDELFELVLSNASPALALPTLLVGGTILNDDSQLSIQIARETHEGHDGTTSLDFEVTRDGDVTDAVSVEFVVSPFESDSADADDFAGGVWPSGLVQFAAGESTKVLSIPIAGDQDVESDEAFWVLLSAPSLGATLGNSQSQGTIRNDDALVTLVAVDSEGEEGSGVYAFLLSREGAVDSAVTVGYRVVGSGEHPADAEDFVGGALVEGSVGFAPGQVEIPLEIPLLDDDRLEQLEGFEVVLEPQSLGLQLGPPAVGRIIDNDSEFTLSAAGDSIVEGSESPGVFEFRVLRQGDLRQDATVRYRVDMEGDGAAQADDFLDSTELDVQVDFASGVEAVLVTLHLEPDLHVEDPERFVVRLEDAVGAQLGEQAHLEVTVLDDDRLVSIRDVEAIVDEGPAGAVSEFRFVVSRIGDVQQADQVGFEVSGLGSADADDFVGGQLPAGQLEFLPGEEAKTIVIDVAGDDELEPNESFVVSLLDPGTTLQLGKSSVGGQIINDDVLFTIVEEEVVIPEGDEGETTFVYEVRRQGDLRGERRVAYEVLKDESVVLPGDANGNGEVGFDDFLRLATNFGKSGTFAEGDFNGDGRVEFPDFLILARYFGKQGLTAADFVGDAFPAGELVFQEEQETAHLEVVVTADQEEEIDERFLVTLVAAPGGKVGDDIGTGVIRNDDGPGHEESP